LNSGLTSPLGDMPTALGNFVIKTPVNSPLHPILGSSIAVINVIGSKTGNSIETPVNVVRVGGVLMIISMRNRTWWRNLRNGRATQLRYGGKLVPVLGEVLEGPSEVASGRTDYFSQYSGYAKYFSVSIDPDGKPNHQDLERVAGDRIII